MTLALPERVRPIAGIYTRAQMSREDYDRIDAINFSRLKHLARSPKHYRHVCDEGVEQTTPMRLGTAAHVAVLEPAQFTRVFAVIADKEDGKAPKRGTKAWEAFAAANNGKELLKQAEFDCAMSIRDAVRGDELAMRYLRRGEPEVTLVWQDPETGVWCKCRVDWLSSSVPNAIAELKTAASVAPFNFQAAYARMLYHGQAAFQTDGLSALLGVQAWHKCIAVESKAPHDVVVYDVLGEPLEAGTELYRDLLKQLGECQREGVWHGYGQGAEVSLRLPPWAVANDDDLADLGLTMGDDEEQ